MRGRDWLTANLKVMVVSSRMNVSCRRFSDLAKSTANVANAMLLMKNCTAEQHIHKTAYSCCKWSTSDLAVANRSHSASYNSPSGQIRRRAECCHLANLAASSDYLRTMYPSTRCHATHRNLSGVWSAANGSAVSRVIATNSTLSLSASTQ